MNNTDHWDIAMTNPLAFLKHIILPVIICAPLLAVAEAPESMLARCLTNKGAILYVADWCRYCTRTLDEFGPSVASLKVVHCFDDRSDDAICEKLDLVGVPTWIAPGRERLIGFTPLRDIAVWSNCENAE